MRSKLALRNMIASLALQGVTMLCGIILPRLFIAHYGSVVNAACSSVTQFLGYIVLFEAGVGGVVRAALYKPLANGDRAAVSSILRTTDRFFRRVALIFIVYATAVACIYPFLVREHFDFLFTAALVLIIAVSTFAQYFFGMSRQVLLQADQRRYIPCLLQIGTLIVNTVLCVLLIRAGASVHIVKLGTTCVFALRPILLRFIVRKRYKPDLHAPPDPSAIAQRWDGFGHHTAFFLHTNTDVFVLTVFSGFVRSLNFADVSVYAVYYGIVAGIEKVIAAFSGGIEAAFGNMLAREETQTLQSRFGVYEFFSFTLTTILFTCTGILLLPFLAVYTRGVTDADYQRPLFGLLLVLAEAVYCIRIPYNNVTLAAGHYRQTRNGAFVEAGINILCSVLLVIPFGLAGVAAATLLAMTVRTVQYAVYLSKHILCRPLSVFFLRCLVFGAASALSVLCLHALPHPTVRDYLDWGLFGLETCAVCSAITLLSGVLIYRQDAKTLLQIARNSIYFHKEESA